MKVKLPGNGIATGVFLLLLGCCGCAKLTVEASGTPQDKCPRETVWKSGYGFDWSDYKIRKATGGIGLYQVTIHRDYWQSLVTVVSLGLVVPVQYEYQLQQPPVSVPPPGDARDEMKPASHLKR